MSDRSQKFVEYIIQGIQQSKGMAAALRRADNPATEYQSWEILAGFNIKLDYENERLPFAYIAADLARVKATANGKLSIGQVIALCYEERSQSDQAKAKLRRLLACDTTAEVCRILRPLLSLAESKGVDSIDYVSLLDDLLWFSRDESRQKIKSRWAQHFYAKQAEGETDE